MTNILRLTVPVLVLGLALVAVPSEAEACSCGPVPAPKVALEGAEAAFVGQVLSQRRVPNDGGVAMIEYAFEIKHSYKGPTGRATVLTNSSSAACGRTFEVGEAYMVYASVDDKGRIRDSACSRTRLASEADEDFAAIGKPSGPLEDLPDDAPSMTQAGNPVPPVSGELTLNNFDVITSQCHTMVQGPISGLDLVQIVTHAGPSGFVCARDTTVTGNVELKEAGIRLVALGEFNIDGHLIIAQPAVLIGATVRGATIISERAYGTVLTANSFEGPVLTATTQILGLGNVCKTECVGPAGGISLSSFIPSSATGIVQEVPAARMRPAPTDDTGMFKGWLAPDRRQPRPVFEDKPEIKEIDLGDLTNEWPPPLEGMPGGSDDADLPWLLPVYGGDGPQGVFVPLHPGRFRKPDGGFVLVP